MKKQNPWKIIYGLNDTIFHMKLEEARLEKELAKMSEKKETPLEDLVDAMISAAVDSHTMLEWGGDAAGAHRQYQELRTELFERIAKLSEGWQLVELEDGVEVVYVGVHAVRWQREWGKPTVGFVRAE